MKKIIIVLIGAMATLPLGAQEAAADQQAVETVLRPVTSAYTLSVGSSSSCDTYLSPLTYKGWSVGLGYERMQAMKFDPENFVMQLQFGADLTRGLNPAKNAYMFGFELRADWGMMRRWRLPVPGLTLALGGSTSLSGGALYKSRPGNNPVSAKAAWTVNLTGYAAWNVRLGRLPVTLRYQPELPLLGVFFSPQYDELYYEIYLGNRRDLAHFAYPGSRFCMTNCMTADLHFGSTALRIGYRGTILSSRANNLTTNLTTNAFVIGISGEWISLNPSRSLSEQTIRTISALYEN